MLSVDLFQEEADTSSTPDTNGGSADVFDDETRNLVAGNEVVINSSYGFNTTVNSVTGTVKDVSFVPFDVPKLSVEYATHALVQDQVVEGKTSMLVKQFLANQNSLFCHHLAEIEGSAVHFDCALGLEEVLML